MRKLHKYIGLLLLPFIIAMAVSGIILNHRNIVKHYEIDRRFLPDAYTYDNWNMGFVKGGLPYQTDRLLIYGNEGLWTTDGKSWIKEANQGIDSKGDGKKIVKAVRTRSGKWFALSPFELYTASQGDDGIFHWKKIPIGEKEAMYTDMAVRGDSLVVMTRSHCLTANTATGNQLIFSNVTLPDSPDRQRGMPMFNFVWDLHSGELFGLTGKLIVDCLGLLLIIVSLTGMLFWWQKRKGKKAKGQITRFYFRWHDRLGYWLLLPLAIVVLTGAMLRPPLLIAIAGKKVPGTADEHPINPWEDKLRSISYDSIRGEWLIYTADGMFATDALNHTEGNMNKLPTPPVSVMGITVMQPSDQHKYLIGSFSGLYLWDRNTSDYSSALPNRTSGEPSLMPRIPGVFSEHQVAGLLSYPDGTSVVFDYKHGAEPMGNSSGFIRMPDSMSHRGMSLWNIALEIHTGRILTILEPFTIILPFLLGVTLAIVLWSGWKLSRLRSWLSHLRRAKIKS